VEVEQMAQVTVRRMTLRRTMVRRRRRMVRHRGEASSRSPIG
jgi:hypothetical protein